MSPLVWDLGHIAAFEDLWLVHRFGGEPLLRDDLADVYDAFETPRAGRGELPFLGPGEAREYLDEVRARDARADRRSAGSATAPARAGDPPRAAAQRDDAPDAPARAPRPATSPSAATHGAATGGRSRAPTGLELIEIPAGECTIGAARGRLRLRQRAPPPPHRRARLPDRPHPDHQRHLPDVRRGRRLRAPRVVVGRGLGVEGGVRHHPTRGLDGGPGRRVAPGQARAARPAPARRPRLLVRGRRLRPRARRPPPHRDRVGEGGDLGPGAGAAPAFPWGDEPPVPGVHANVDHVGGGPAPAGAHPGRRLAVRLPRR